MFDDKDIMDQYDHKLLTRIKKQSLQDQCQSLQELFQQRTESMHYYKEKVDQCQQEKNSIMNECRRKVREIRSFWRDKLYNENSRSGSILKNALTFHSV